MSFSAIDQLLGQKFRQEFKHVKDSVYLDHAGSTLYPSSLIQKHLEDLEQNLYGNPHSGNLTSSLTNDAVESVRARFGNVDSPAASEESSDSSPGLVYLTDNHTSVLGMRAVVMQRGVAVQHVTPEHCDRVFNPAVHHSITNNDMPLGLFVYPAQSNFSGRRFPLDWTRHVHSNVINPSRNWFVLLDAAAYVSNAQLDLHDCNPDFVAISFYKMFGFPTGLGALLVRNSCSWSLQKTYFGGGTVDVVSATSLFVVKKSNLHKRFEDGTIPFQQILALRHAFSVYETFLPVSLSSRHLHTFLLARYVIGHLQQLRHPAGGPVCELYCHDPRSPDRQGPVVCFNVLRADGAYVGYSQVEQLASLYNIQLRTGCFCNIGACQSFLSLSDKDLRINHARGHVCGDQVDLVDGCPTGAVRVSFGWCSMFSDAIALLTFIEECFVDGATVTTKEEHMKNLRKLDKMFNELHVSSPQRTRDVTTECRASDSLSAVISTPSASLSHNSSTATLTGITLFPVKSCAGQKVTSWPLGPRGLQYDRCWLILTPAGGVLTQKQEPRLCMIRPRVDVTTQNLVITADFAQDISECRVPLNLDESNGQWLSVRVCSSRTRGLDCGDSAGRWLSRVLDRPGLQLVRQSETPDPTSCDPAPRDRSRSFANDGQLLLVNRQSVLSLSTAIDMEESNILDRFRANLVVDGFPAYSERLWASVKIGLCEFTVLRPCTRCAVICIDQKDGVRNKAPLHELMRQQGSKTEFGLLVQQKCGSNYEGQCQDNVLRLHEFVIAEGAAPEQTT